MRPIISETAEVDSAVPKQLAALSEFTTPVNCVRFAPAGRLLAAGSDDADAYVFELREGRGSALFGSGEAANIENWKLRLRLRGHEINVADLAWAPDSRRLATASVDNKVKVRNPAPSYWHSTHPAISTPLIIRRVSQLMYELISPPTTLAPVATCADSFLSSPTYYHT